jgi:hypothetical protein
MIADEETTLEYWLYTNIEDMDETKVFQSPSVGAKSDFYESKYEYTKDEHNVATPVGEYVLYHIGGYPDVLSSKKCVVGIVVADPEVNVYGISTKTNFEEAKNVLKSKGFKIVEEEYVYNQQGDVMFIAQKNEITLRFSNNFISISIPQTNKSGVVF